MPTRLTSEARVRLLRALEAFANLGDDPSAWRRFRNRWPDFVPEQMWRAAEQSLRQPAPPGRGTAINFVRGFRASASFCRDQLREVWTRNDRDGIALSFLLGWGQDAVERLAAGMKGYATARLMTGGYRLTMVTVGGLPLGTPVVNGVTGLIDWQFECQIQQAVYELMRERWRAMVCPACGRYFVAVKTASKYCSARCAHTVKNRQALDYVRRKRAAKRAGKSVGRNTRGRRR